MNALSHLFRRPLTAAARAVGAAWLFALGLVAVAHAQSLPVGISQKDTATLLAVEGQVDLARNNSAEWEPAQRDATLIPGDRLRTGPNSRATLRLSDLSVFRVNEMTTLQLRLPAAKTKRAMMDVKSGSLYFFSREKPLDVHFRTPTAAGAIRGTEFLLQVAESGETLLALIDGAVDLNNEHGALTLAAGEVAQVAPGKAPLKTAGIAARNLMQWCFYYPGVLDPKELGLSAGEQAALADSVRLYTAGDLLQALALFPKTNAPSSDAAKVFHAALLLAVGQVEHAEAALATLAKPSATAAALRRVIAAVQYHAAAAAAAPASASEWLAESYYEQSRQHLPAALAHARKAAEKSPEFGFAWVRVAELEFSFGRTREALVALDKGLALAPRNAQGLALKGFLLSAKNQTKEALGWFDRAIAIDGALGNAWLGRGLCRIREGRGDEGRQDLQVAATLEPQRAILRSYLGKAWSHTGNEKLADKDLALAKKLDPNDPTPWLYSALLNQERGRINEAIQDFEQSRALNDNRSVFRSGLLLDQDRAVRSANLATAYRDAGMPETGHREASRAVTDDYANFSSHLFLHETYEALRDPKQFNLRYDNARISEFLIANLLAPVGASSLSQGVSQQEYTRLFDTKRIGVSSQTEYSSHGDWRQTGSQFGNFGNFGYALDAAYRAERGYRVNNDLEQRDVTFRSKFDLTAQDSVFLQATMYEGTSGDVQQYFSQAMGSPTLRVTERQEPNLLAGYHHEWAPGVHTLFLAGRLDDTLQIGEPNAMPLFLKHSGKPITFVTTPPLFHFNYQRESEAYVAEAQQIWQTAKQTFIAGVAYQHSTFNTDSLLDRTLQGVVADQHFQTSQERYSAYAYETFRPIQQLSLQAGLTYDQLRHPKNIDIVPITTGDETTQRLSPKLGFQFTPFKEVKLRGAYTRSLGGAFNENTYRLEPTQIGGFNQSYRSVLPESVAGLVPASRFETRNLALDLNFDTGTFLSLEGELLHSKATRTVGVLTNSTFFPVPDRASSTSQRLEFEEKSLFITVNQLLGKEWSIGARYRLSQANLTGRFDAVPATAAGAAAIMQNEEALLHQLNLGVNYNHRCGFFAQWLSVWSMQENSGYAPARSTADFWQHSVYAGYRFAKRHAELRVGVVNLANQNYQLNPLNLYAELPRERTVTVGLKLNF